MSKIQILGISGGARVGKDFLGKTVLEPLGYKPFSLAWHFKVWVIGRGLATYEEVFVTKPPHIRKLLQQAGTEEGRLVYGEDVWCHTAETWLKILSESWNHYKFYVPDCRFPNEAEFVRRMGGKIIRIEAPERYANNDLTPEARLHPSERAMDGFKGFDAVIKNDPMDNGIEALKAFVDFELDYLPNYVRCT